MIVVGRKIFKVYDYLLWFNICSDWVLLDLFINYCKVVKFFFLNFKYGFDIVMWYDVVLSGFVCGDGIYSYFVNIYVICLCVELC